MSATKWSETAGKLLGNIAAIYFSVVFAVVVLTLPTKALFMLVSWFWNMF
jgi:hypothetical protein